MIRDKTENLVGDKLHDHAYYQRWDSESTVGLIAVAKPITKAVLSLLCAEIEKMGLTPDERNSVLIEYALEICESNPVRYWNQTEVIDRMNEAQLQKILKELGGAE